MNQPMTETRALMPWSRQHTSRFPGNHRFVLGERIERNLYELLETLIQAKYQRERVVLLEAANLKLEIRVLSAGVQNGADTPDGVL